jgi:hypothetical protein
MKIWCCGCECEVDARLADGAEIYPHRKYLAALPFWRCDTCRNFVGCHHKTKEPTKPLGVIPTPEIKAARQHIHRILDPIWKSGRVRRGTVYARIANHMGWNEYHTAELRSLADARKVYAFVLTMRNQP